MTADEILWKWKDAHDMITDLYVRQGRPENIKAWGGEYNFKKLHDDLANEVNRQLYENDFISIPEGEPLPKWATAEGKKFSDLM